MDHNLQYRKISPIVIESDFKLIKFELWSRGEILLYSKFSPNPDHSLYTHSWMQIPEFS